MKLQFLLLFVYILVDSILAVHNNTLKLFIFFLEPPSLYLNFSDYYLYSHLLWSLPQFYAFNSSLPSFKCVLGFIFGWAVSFTTDAMAYSEVKNWKKQGP